MILDRLPWHPPKMVELIHDMIVPLFAYAPEHDPVIQSCVPVVQSLLLVIYASSIIKIFQIGRSFEYATRCT